MQNYKCFGFPEDCKNKKCKYAQSCEQFAEIEKKEKKSNGAWNSRKGNRTYNDEYIGGDNVIGKTEISVKKAYTASDMAIMMHIMINVAENPKILEVFKLKIQGVKNISEIARKMGTSRQNLHKRIEFGIYRLLEIGKNKKKIINLDILDILTINEIEILQLLKNKNSIRDIAKKSNKSKSKISRDLKKIKSKLGLKVSL